MLPFNPVTILKNLTSGLPTKCANKMLHLIIIFIVNWIKYLSPETPIKMIAI